MKYVFVDESRTTPGTRYQLFGSLWMDRSAQDEFRQQFYGIWDEHFPSRNSELKWTKVSRGKIDAYKSFIDWFATLPDIDFRCVVLDTHAIDYQRHHDGDKELGFYKFLFFFLSRNIEKDYNYRAGRDYHQIFIDERSPHGSVEVGRLQDLKTVLNNRLGSACIEVARPLVRNVEAMNSKQSPEIQVVDVLLGAVGYSWEGFQTSPAKLDLIQHIENTIGLSLGKSTPFLTDKINIWKFQLKK